MAQNMIGEETVAGTVSIASGSSVGIATDSVLVVRTTGNGAARGSLAYTGTFAPAAATIGTLQAGKSYGLRIFPQTDGDTVLAHYRSDGTTADVNDCPISGTDGEHVIIPSAATSVSIAVDTVIVKSLYYWLYPLNGGTIT